MINGTKIERFLYILLEIFQFQGLHYIEPLGIGNIFDVQNKSNIKKKEFSG